MLTIAHHSDLELPEFVAYREGQPDLPWMRQWESPFAMTQAHFEETSAVLDCTINPAGFAERLRALFPNVSYRHCSPLRNQEFRLPEGIPDGAYDRVLCLNTLEHLLRDQREQVIAELARKLKPGGRLVLTSDSYFDGSWNDPAFLSTGVIREDRSEVFNGFNKVTLAEWRDLCAGHGLRALEADGTECLVPLEPVEGDDDLFLNRPPHVHACIGGVFTNGAPSPWTGSRRVVLALLTWNTRQPSLESVAALLQEVRTLTRLGHRPSLCVCDNGSTDGTAQSLRDLDPTLNVERQFILNNRNLGNSIARNQIIDHALEIGADYVFFVDGDIEIVPFSSLAMLRYLEGHGHRLGCIGAHSWGQSNARAETTRALWAVDPARTHVTDIVAWTQYGMFRCEMFAEGLRFETASPFNGAGWGFEDNDLAFQMAVAGYDNHYFTGMTYLHRDARSSLRVMRRQGIDAAGLYEARRRFLLDKWAAIPRITSGPLREVARVTIPSF